MANVLQFYAVLEDIAPPVWRRLQISERETFWGLHCALQDTFGWLDYHLHEFILGQGGDTTLHIGIPDDEGLGDTILPGWKQPLAPIFTSPGFEMLYLYDFGDDWHHRVRFEGAVPAEKGVRYPRCLDGERAGPPEDVGGPHGYAEFLEALADPRHPEHEDMKAWVGIDFQAERFDPAAVRFSRPLPRLRKAGLLAG